MYKELNFSYFGNDNFFHLPENKTYEMYFSGVIGSLLIFGVFLLYFKEETLL